MSNTTYSEYVVYSRYVRKEDYDAIKHELSAARAEVEALREDYAKLQELVTSQGLRLMEAECAIDAARKP